MSSRRETQVVEMMRLPPDENGMGCKSDFDAFAEIEKRTTEVILLLHERGRPPNQVSTELIELLVWKKIFTRCGT